MNHPWALRRDPWRPPRVLAAVTALYLAWTLIPIAYGIRASMSVDTVTSHPVGFTLQWFPEAIRDPALVRAFAQTVALAIGTVVIATPLGTMLAIGIHRRGGRGPVAASGLEVLAIATPQIALAFALFWLVITVISIEALSTGTQLIGHVTLAIPWVVIVVIARLRAIEPEYEETAMDLGATWWGSLWRVLLPMALPAIVVAAAIAFVLSWDNIALSSLLCNQNDCRTIPTSLFGFRNAFSPPPPIVFAITVLTSLVSFGVLLVGLLVVRRRGGGRDARGRAIVAPFEN